MLGLRDEVLQRAFGERGVDRLRRELAPGLPEVGLLVLRHVDREQAGLPLRPVAGVDEVGERLLRRVRELDGRGEAAAGQNDSPVSSSYAST